MAERKEKVFGIVLRNSQHSKKWYSQFFVSALSLIRSISTFCDLNLINYDIKLWDESVSQKCCVFNIRLSKICYAILLVIFHKSGYQNLVWNFNLIFIWFIAICCFNKIFFERFIVLSQAAHFYIYELYMIIIQV